MKSKPHGYMLTEHEIQRQIIDWLRLRHIFFWRNNTGAFSGTYKGKKRFVRFGTPGAPDIFAVVQGRIIGIEVKRPGEQATLEQAAFGTVLEAAGGIWFIARSLDDVIEVFGSP